MEKQDSSSFLPSSPATSPKHDGSLFSSPLAGSEKVGGSDATIPVHDRNEALNNAAALLTKGRAEADAQLARKKQSGHSVLPRHLFHDTGSGGGSTMHGSPSGEPHAGDAGRRLERQGHPSGGTLVRSMAEKEADGQQLVITTSLLDPHPVIVPPPGSRLAFAGVNTPVMQHLFRALPSLEDTLLRQAKAPLCLYNYWQYLADIEAGPEELEFWLSLADYEALHRKATHGALPLSSPYPAISAQATGASSARQRNGRIESGALGFPSPRDGTATGDRLLSQLHERHIDTFDTETQELDKFLANLSHRTRAATDSACTVHRQCTHAHRPFTAAHASGRPTLDTPAQQRQRHGLRGFFNRVFSGEPAAGAKPAPHEEDAHAAQQQPLLSSSLQADDIVDAPSDDELRRLAERLYFHYLLPGAPAELRVSPKMRDEIASRIERDARFDAPLFAPVKRHAYEAMRHESHLRFLRERLFHNITRGTAAPRIALGLSLVFVALTFQLSLILLDVKPKGWRWLPMAGLWVGLAYAVAGVTRLDPFMAFMGRYEATAWSFGRVQDTTIRHSHLKRAAMQLIVTAGVAALITLVLFLVPGNHI
ncbi:Bud site selection protein, Revert to axial protein 1 [Coemansia sp. RSA 2708]|nr:Bud site selection protein, Revert to axial protein 1 [Coemansia sp. RSA 2708]